MKWEVWAKEQVSTYKGSYGFVVAVISRTTSLDESPAGPIALVLIRVLISIQKRRTEEYAVAHEWGMEDVRVLGFSAAGSADSSMHRNAEGEPAVF